MPPVEVVCDASVVLKWFHAEGEQEVDPARRLLDLQMAHSVSLSVLDLTFYELGNVLVRTLHVDPPRAFAVLDALDAICLRLTPTSTELESALSLAARHCLTVYDSAYAAVAQSRKAQVATLDRALLEAGLGVKPGAITGG